MTDGNRTKFLIEIFEKYIPKDYTILEIGCGDGGNINALKEVDYKFVDGIDKKDGTAIEDVEPKEYNVIFTMSTLFLIKDEKVFNKIAKMAQKFILTFEGESKEYGNVFYHDYEKIFSNLGFKQIEHQDNMFNQYGHLRVFKKNG